MFLSPLHRFDYSIFAIIARSFCFVNTKILFLFFCVPQLALLRPAVGRGLAPAASCASHPRRCHSEPSAKNLILRVPRTPRSQLLIVHFHLRGLFYYQFAIAVPCGALLFLREEK
jgi:hypothetical protein